MTFTSPSKLKAVKAQFNEINLMETDALKKDDINVIQMDIPEKDKTKDETAKKAESLL